MGDLIRRQEVIDELEERVYANRGNAAVVSELNRSIGYILKLPTAQPEPLTDKEQRIFLAAMAREEQVCKEIDMEMTREPYEDSLVSICREIERKVKKALWTN